MTHIKSVEAWDYANTQVQALFAELFANADTGTVDLFTQRLSANAQQVDLVLGAHTGAIREWIGAKRSQPARAYHLLSRFRQFESTLTLKRKDVAYDPAGQVKNVINQFMEDGRAAYDKIFHDELVSAGGAGPTCYDGQPLLSTAHPHGPSGNQSNKTTSALSPTTFDSACQSIRLLRKENGEPMGLEPTHLVVGPKLARTAMEIVEADTRGRAVDNTGAEGGTVVAVSTIPNVYAGLVTLVIDYRLNGTQDDYWYVLALNKGSMRPIVMIEQRGIELVSQTDMASTGRFQNDEFSWSLEADVSPTAGAWQTIYGGIL